VRCGLVWCGEVRCGVVWFAWTKIKANVHTIKHVTICNPILMTKPNHNPIPIDGEVLEPVKVLKYLGPQYLLGNFH
jgi:hypothetical protein